MAQTQSSDERVAVDGICLPVRVLVCIVVNRLPSELPVGWFHLGDQNLAIVRQAGNKQKTCWHLRVGKKLKAYRGTRTHTYINAYCTRIEAP